MSKIEVDTIDKQSGSTLTLGGSGTAVTLASGATQSGFGRTGTVDWQTTIKTSTFTAVSGEGYFVNTTGGVVTVNLPAASVGDIISVKDYAQTFDSNKCTIAANGSEKIEGITNDLDLTTEGVGVTLVYGDSTKGWQAVSSNEVANAVKYICASSPCVATVGDYKIHTFTGPGTFTVNCAGSAAGSNTVDYLVIAGGGGGGSRRGGAGGAGGYRESVPSPAAWTSSPIANPGGALPVSAQGYSITVGGGGAGNPVPGPSQPSTQAVQGTASTFSSITSTGGGFGGNNTPPSQMNGGTGGSGGGGGGQFCAQAGAGNTPPTSPAQGFNGGTGNTPPYGPGEYGGGGGGATAVGTPGTLQQAGPGGAGAVSEINNSPVQRAGGGGGGADGGPNGAPTRGSGGAGGGGQGGYPGSNPGSAGTANTGGGGGGSGGGAPTNGGNGGSGLIIIRYKFQN
jgi:hypothetical protein